ncbi:MAG TPA: cell wall-binding repeat-containing protein [Desulfitobacteriaceae bacterium]|nr:cell wall-binding repeat-containing protein [Desulfitobacteriaceae bacterium]
MYQFKMGYSSESIYQYGGQDCHEKSLIIAKALNSKPAAVALVSDANFYDALTAAPFLAALSQPILLVSPAGLNAEQKQYLDESQSMSSTVYEFGEITGTAAGKSIKNTYANVYARHPWLMNSYTLSTYWAHTQVEIPSPVVYLATGEDYPDALAGAVLASYAFQGYQPGFILLTKPDELPA